MAAPIQLRNFHKRFTLDDAVAGVMPIRDLKKPEELYCPAVSQYRYKMKINSGDKIEMVWSEWIVMPFVKEGSPEDAAD